ncbi:MAG: WXG100 family type VII secretion target [Mycobacteriales bacterium]
MAYEVKVSTGDVTAKAGAIAREAQEIEARLAQLTGQMTDLSHTWTGAAASSFQTLFHDWDRTARQMKEALDSIGLSLKGAGRDYDALEQKLTSQFA